MKNRYDGKTGGKILLGVTCGLFAVLIFLISALLISFSSDSKDKSGDFDIGMITEGGAGYEDISGILIPEFIGITVNGQRSGISVSSNIVSDIFDSFAGTVSCVLCPDNSESITDEVWNGLGQNEASAYIRFHTELPETVVGVLCDMKAGEERVRNGGTAHIYEMFILPYEVGEGMRIATRSLDGGAIMYKAVSPDEYLTAVDFETIKKTYSQNMKSFVFAEDSFPSFDETEPVFTDTVKTKNIIITNGTASFAYNTTQGANNLMKAFGMNPDKVRISYTEDDSAAGYIDTRGAFYIRDTMFEYKAAADGGVEIKRLIGYAAPDREEIEKYIRAAYSLLWNVRSLDKNYCGGEAEIFLSSVSAEDGTVTVEMRYSYDNLKISGMPPAIRAVFCDGLMKEASVYTVAIRGRNDRNESVPEWAFGMYLDSVKEKARNVCLEYRADYESEAVRAEWTAECIE